MARLLVAREAQAAEKSAARLRALGHWAEAAPVSRIEPTGAAISLTGVQAIAFTSAVGVRCFAEASAERSLPVFAVGGASASAARAAGFPQIAEGKSGGAELARIIQRTLSPEAGAVLHAGGEELAFDLATALRKAGFTARHAALYRAAPLGALPDAAAAALYARPPALDAVLLYSPAGATFFNRLARGAETHALAALCLSPAVAAAARVRPWARVEAAASPSEEALFALAGAS